MNYKQANNVSNWLLIGAVTALGGTFFFNGIADIIAFALGGIGLISAIVVRIVFWRCPHCKKALQLGYGMEPKICPKCRQPLITEEEEKNGRY